jgi:hypothetical protein
MDEPSLLIEFTFDKNSGMFIASLENGAKFAVAPHNIGGKLKDNLTLLRNYITGEDKTRPYVRPPSADDRLIEEAIAAGKLQKVGVITKPTIDLLDF